MNYENFNRVLTHIEQHPEQWNQARPYRRVTPHCFLAHTVQMLAPETPFYDGLEASARPILGIGFDFATWLYNTDRTLDDFRRVRQVYAHARLVDARVPKRPLLSRAQEEMARAAHLRNNPDEFAD